MINLTVPYSSQWDNDATISKNDCGAASIKMVLQYFGIKDVTTDKIVTDLGLNGGQYTSIAHIKDYLSRNKLEFEYYSGEDQAYQFNKMKSCLDRGMPCFTVVHYGEFNSRQDKQFAGAHIFVIVGYREDGVFVNDPDFFAQYRADGDHHFYTNQEFLNGWKMCPVDGNKANQFLAVIPKAGIGGAIMIPDYSDVFVKYGYPVDPPVETVDVVFKNFKEWNDKLQKGELIYKNDILVELQTAKDSKELFDFMNEKNFEGKLHYPDGLKDVFGALYTGYLKSKEYEKAQSTVQAPTQPVSSVENSSPVVQNDVDIINLLKGEDMSKLIEFFNGKKTYILAIATVLYAIAGFVIGKVPGEEAIGLVLAGLGLSTLRAGVTAEVRKLLPTQ